MITLLASIAGFIGSIVPEIIKLFKDKNDKRHELDIMQKQIEMAQAKLNDSLQEIQLHNDHAHYQALYNTYKTGVTWVDALNGTVRPIMAYSFFALYTFLKYMQLQCVRGVYMIEHIDIIWSTDDQAIFAGIISFYFGQRTFTKLWKR